MSDQANVPVSVVILTFQEAGNIADCIRSCRGLGDVHVLDSGSTDGTCAVAAAEGAQVWTHPFSTLGPSATGPSTTSRAGMSGSSTWMPMNASRLRFVMSCFGCWRDALPTRAFSCRAS